MIWKFFCFSEYFSYFEERNVGKQSKVAEMFYLRMQAVVTWVYTYVKLYYFRFIHVIVCMIYLNGKWEHMITMTNTFYFDTGSGSVSQASLELGILLHQPPK